MQKGFNSDVQYKGQSYHVQTEDWGLSNPFLVSRVFRQGVVVKTVKVSYQEAFARNKITAEVIQLALRRQHHEMMDSLISGKLV